MSKFKHTPGPWDWGLNDGQFQLEGNVEYKDMNPILVAFDCGCKVEKRESTPRCPLSPTDADMNLIAAAPEMLEALIFVRKFINDFRLKDKQLTPEYFENIIKKATGLKWNEIE